MTQKFTITGLSLLELKEKYGTGSSGFYSSWWITEDFAKEKPEAGVYEIDFSTKLVNLTFAEQKEKLTDGFMLPHPAILAEAILSHYTETKERLCDGWWSRTDTTVSGGHRVGVGSFDSDGLHVSGVWDGYRNGRLGLASARKFTNPENRKLDTIDPLDPSEISFNFRGKKYGLREL